jgi:hypothetical protein
VFIGPSAQLIIVKRYLESVSCGVAVGNSKPEKYNLLLSN